MPKVATAGSQEFMTGAEVADLCRVPESTVRYWRHRGEGPQGFRVGRKTLYRREVVLAWLAQLERQEAEEAAQRTA